MSNKTSDTTNSCHCGCGDTTRGGRYLPGHDAKHKKTLVDAAFAGSKRAASKLQTLGWSKFLEAKRAAAPKAEQKSPAKKRGKQAAAGIDSRKKEA